MQKTNPQKIMAYLVARYRSGEPFVSYKDIEQLQIKSYPVWVMRLLKNREVIKKRIINGKTSIAIREDRLPYILWYLEQKYDSKGNKID